MVMKTNWRKARALSGGGLLVDPYFEWTVVTKYAYYGDVEKLPLLVELRREATAELARLLSDDEDKPRRSRTREAGADDDGDRSGHFMSVLHSRERAEALYRSRDEHDFIRRFELSRAIKLPAREQKSSSRARKVSSSVKRSESGGRGKREKGKGGARAGRLVVTGIIDDSIAFAHERFRGADGKTRIEWFWDQTEPSSTPPPYGRELSKQGAGGIDDLLATCTHNGLVDEDEVYRRSGLTDQSLPGHKPLAWRASHGTLVSDIACGGDRPANPIVCVQLPVATTADTSGASLSKQVYDAVEYILRRADEIAAANGQATVPIVINLSYGLFAGPHDGTSILEVAIDEFIALRIPPKGTKSELCVVIPSGNAHLSRCHANLCLNGGEDLPLNWRVPPDDRTESFLEIWPPQVDEAGVPPRIEVSLITPTGDAVLLPAGDPGQEWTVGGEVVCSIMRYTAAQTGSRELIKISLAPTASPEGGLPLAPSGSWLLRIRNCGTVPVHGINAWIQRDDTPYGYPRRGRQSYFEDAEYRRLDAAGREIEEDNAPANNSNVKRSGLFNAIATGGGPIVIGGYRRSDGRCAKYSASGPVVHPPGRGAPSSDGPEAMTVSEDSVACQGVLGAGARSGSTIAMNGTSVAAPRAARAIVDYLIANPHQLVDRQSVFDWAQAADANPPPEPRAGGGRIPLPPVAPASPIKRVDV